MTASDTSRVGQSSTVREKCRRPMPGGVDAGNDGDDGYKDVGRLTLSHVIHSLTWDFKFLTSCVKRACEGISQ